MDSFDHQHIVAPQLKFVALILFLSGQKIECGQGYFLSPQKRLHLAVEQLNVHGSQTFKIIVAVFIPRRVFPFHKIIVHSDRMRFQSVRHQLDRQPVGKSCLAGRRRTGDHDQFLILPGCDLRRDVSQFFLHHGFLGENDIADLPVHNLLVQRPDRTCTQYRAPFPGIFQRGKYFILRRERSQFTRIFHGRELQHKSFVKRNQVKTFQVSGIGHHISIIIILESVQAVYVDC